MGHDCLCRHVASLGVTSLIAALDACTIGGAVKGGAQAEDVVGVLVNLGLDDDLVAAMGKAGAVSSLLSILTPLIKSAASTPGRSLGFFSLRSLGCFVAHPCVLYRLCVNGLPVDSLHMPFNWLVGFG